jgi:hypothetical protein
LVGELCGCTGDYERSKTGDQKPFHPGRVPLNSNNGSAWLAASEASLDAQASIDPVRRLPHPLAQV